ncbi:MAG: flagellar hook-associated protein FlgK [Chloroflexi bacterium]|nr:flagellar hook-associated protein FlgK [Chloroflexota bacterium]
MLGLFGALNLSARSLQIQQQGVEVAGHNLANVNNPSYARQRLVVQTSLTIPTDAGQQGTGVDSIAIVQLRNVLVDRQIQTETSVRGSLEAQQQALQNAQANLGQQIDRGASSAEGAAATQSVGAQNGLAENLSDLFNAFQSLSTEPTSLTERQVLLTRAQNLATQFNLVSQRLDGLRNSLNDSLTGDVAQANELLHSIARLNEQIVATEAGGSHRANDLRDVRQQKLEGLGKLVKIDSGEDAQGAINISTGGESLITGSTVVDTLQAADAGGGQILVALKSSGKNLALTGGSMQGTIEVRDGALSALQSDLNTLASQLISEVNAVHRTGFSLSGATGENFFAGSNAADIAVNAKLAGDPGLIQAGGIAGAAGDNQAVLALAQLAEKRIGPLNNQTFSQSYGQTVAKLGQALASVNAQIENQEAVESMLQRQRDAISGVSLDEEMTDLMKFQKAFEASARLITTIDAMLDTVLNLKR